MTKKIVCLPLSSGLWKRFEIRSVEWRPRHQRCFIKHEPVGEVQANHVREGNSLRECCDVLGFHVRRANDVWFAGALRFRWLCGVQFQDVRIT